MQYLLNKRTGVISVEGDMEVSNYEESMEVYETVEVEEVEITEGFQLVGTRADGNILTATLTFEQYFEGKQFKIDKI